MNAYNLTQKDLILKTYDDIGYVTIDDFLPEKQARQMLGWYEKASWELMDQVRPEHYKHVFAMNTSQLPGPDEAYKARFDRSKTLEQSGEFKALFQEHFAPTLKEISRLNLTTYDARCYRMAKGHFYRTHIDDYAGAIGLIYYINPRWCWDWGGLLHVVKDPATESIDVIYPKFNRLVLLNHKRFRFPHFINEVSEYALTPRYTIVSFCT